MSLAVPDQEGPVPPSLQQLLRLLPFHTANVPAPLLLVGIVCEGVRAGGFYGMKIHVINKNPPTQSLCSLSLQIEMLVLPLLVGFRYCRRVLNRDSKCVANNCKQDSKDIK